MDYPASTLVIIKGKWYVSVTVPKALEHHFKQKQIRLSTGTTDKRLARAKQHDVASRIYQRFEDAALSGAKSVEDEVVATIDRFQKLLGFDYDTQDS